MRILAHKDGLALVLAILMEMGAACTTCGHGTRATSKRWAKCKRCGQRVRRYSINRVELDNGCLVVESDATSEGSK